MNEGILVYLWFCNFKNLHNVSFDSVVFACFSSSVHAVIFTGRQRKRSHVISRCTLFGNKHKKS